MAGYLENAGDIAKLTRVDVGNVVNVGKVTDSVDNFDLIKKFDLKDGMKINTNNALDLAEDFLGKGYKEIPPGSGRYISSDGARVVRMGDADITGAHGGGPHMNFETLAPNPSKPGKMMVGENLHIYLTD